MTALALSLLAAVVGWTAMAVVAARVIGPALAEADRPENQ